MPESNCHREVGPGEPQGQGSPTKNKAALMCSRAKAVAAEGLGRPGQPSLCRSDCLILTLPRSLVALLSHLSFPGTPAALRLPNSNPPSQTLPPAQVMLPGPLLLLPLLSAVARLAVLIEPPSLTSSRWH